MTLFDWWLLLVSLAGPPGSFCLWRGSRRMHQRAKRAKDLLKWSQKADEQNQQYLSGDARGFYGDYPPVTGPFTPEPPKEIKPPPVVARNINNEKKPQKAKERKAEERVRLDDVEVYSGPTCSICHNIRVRIVGQVCTTCEIARRNKAILASRHFVCWNCDKEFDGPTGRCPACAEQFGKHRGAKPIGKARDLTIADFGGEGNCLSSPDDFPASRTPRRGRVSEDLDAQAFTIKEMLGQGVISATQALSAMNSIDRLRAARGHPSVPDWRDDYGVRHNPQWGQDRNPRKRSRYY